MNKIQEKEKQRIIDNHVFSYDQNPGESNQSYRLYKTYQNLGISRTYKKVITVCPGKTYGNIAKLAETHQWKLRAAEYDSDKNEEMMLKLEGEILESRMRQLLIGQELQELADKGAKLLLENVEELSPMEIVKMAEIGSKLENLALGSPSEITRSKVESEVKVQVEEIPKEMVERIGKELAIAKSIENGSK